MTSGVKARVEIACMLHRKARLPFLSLAEPANISGWCAISRGSDVLSSPTHQLTSFSADQLHLNSSLMSDQCNRFNQFSQFDHRLVNASWVWHTPMHWTPVGTACDEHSSNGTSDGRQSFKWRAQYSPPRLRELTRLVDPLRNC